MTLKHNQGLWKWNEWVKLHEYDQAAKFVVFYMYSVRENCNVKVYATYEQSVGLTLIITYTHIFRVSFKKKAFISSAQSTCNQNRERMIIIPFISFYLFFFSCLFCNFCDTETLCELVRMCSLRDNYPLQISFTQHLRHFQLNVLAEQERRQICPLNVYYRC